jgi:hypothetical protein
VSNQQLQKVPSARTIARLLSDRLRMGCGAA